MSGMYTDDDWVEWCRLFGDEICSTMSIFVEEWETLEALLPLNLIATFQERFRAVGDLSESDNRERAKAITFELWERLCATPNIRNFISVVLEYLNKVNPQVAELIDYRRSTSSQSYDIISPTKARWKSFMKALRRTKNAFDLRASLDYLMNYSATLKDLLEPINTRWTSGDVDERRARCLFLRNVIYFGPNAIDHYLKTVWDKDAAGKQIVEELRPHFERFYAGILATEQRHDVLIIDDTTSIADAFGKLIIGAKKADPLEVIKISDVHKRSIAVDLAKEGAVDGENTLICAPTNSGKTITTVFIVRKVWYKSIQENTSKRFKAIFLVPTRVLVAQQKEAFSKFMTQLRVSSLSGDDNTPQRITIMNSDICVMTPQILLNILKGQTIEEPFSLTDLSLLIFDEAHRVNERHPYNEIMEFYHDLKATQSTARLPQIIGLTASIGAKDADVLDDAVQYSAKICANLDVRRVNIVRRHLAELRKYAPDVEDEVYPVLCENTTTNFYFDYLRRLAETSFVTLKNILVDVLEPNMLSLVKPEMLQSNMFATLCNLESEVNRSKNVRDEHLRQNINHNLQWLKLINAAICAVRTMDKTVLLDIVNKEARPFIHKTGTWQTKMQELIRTLDRLPDFQSPMLSRTVSLIKEVFLAKPDSRVLVFASTRNDCDSLCSRIKFYTCKEAKYLTGNASCAESGLNPNQQRQTIAEFRDGNVKILCCTSVADEGLDIPECNLVIKYNYATNEVAHIQRKGRGRAADARSVLIAESECIKKAEETNKQRVQLMKDALSFIDGNHQHFLKLIEKQVNDNRQERQKRRLEEVTRATALRNKPHDYVISCKSCGAYVAHQKDMFKSKTFFVICDPEIWMRVETVEINVDRPDSSEPTIGKIQCKAQIQTGKCAHILGSVIVDRASKGVLLPILSCKEIAFVQVHKNYRHKVTPHGNQVIRHQKGKWKLVEQDLFQPPPIRSYELSEMAKVSPVGRFSSNITALRQSMSCSTDSGIVLS